jgi:hypothetical protein
MIAVPSSLSLHRRRFTVTAPSAAAIDSAILFRATFTHGWKGARYSGICMTVQVERRITSPYVKAIIGYWSALRRGRPAPQLDEIDAVDIPRPALPYILLSDVFSRPFRIRYRLVGSHSTDLFGDYKGRFLDDLGLPDGVDDHLEQDYAYAAWTCEPVIGRYPWPKAYGRAATVEYALLPLLQGGGVCRFLCAEHISNQANGVPLHPEDLRSIRAVGG